MRNGMIYHSHAKLNDSGSKPHYFYYSFRIISTDTIFSWAVQSILVKEMIDL
jgi:hypothetical protein